MIKEALKEALMDLKGQMRGRRGKSYMKDVDEPMDKAEAAKDKSDDKLVADASPKEMVSEGMGALKDQMKGFMNKKRKGKSFGRPTVALKNDFSMRTPKKGKSK